jgi:hypothetical protein
MKDGRFITKRILQFYRELKPQYKWLYVSGFLLALLAMVLLALLSIYLSPANISY